MTDATSIFQVPCQGRKRDELVRIGLTPGNFYLHLPDDLVDLTDRMRLHVVAARRFGVRTLYGDVVAVTKGDWGSESYVETLVCLVVIRVVGENGPVDYVPAVLEATNACTNIFRAADREMASINESLHKWQSQSGIHESAAAAALEDWMMFEVRAHSQLKRSGNGRDYFAVKCTTAPTAATDLEQLERLYYSPEWRNGFREVKRQFNNRHCWLDREHATRTKQR